MSYPHHLLILQGRRSKLQHDNIKAIVFDFDGTVANTMPVLESIAVELLQENYGLGEEFARLGYISTTGLPFCQQIDLLFPNHARNQTVVDVFERRKLESIFEQPLFEDTIETLDNLRGQGYYIAVSSSTIQSTIEEYCKRVNIANRLDLILGFAPGFEKGKAHITRACEVLGVTSENILYVGDSLRDADRAIESHVAFIGRTGMFSREDFVKIIPDCPTVSELNELPEVLRRSFESL
ncbi:MAG: HAD family hydrolase [Candidatus Heimdallarchaeota archaeon]